MNIPVLLLLFYLFEEDFYVAFSLLKIKKMKYTKTWLSIKLNRYYIILYYILSVLLLDTIPPKFDEKQNKTKKQEKPKELLKSCVNGWHIPLLAKKKGIRKYFVLYA